MGLEDDFLKNDLDDEKTIEYIKNYLPQELKEKLIRMKWVIMIRMKSFSLYKVKWNIRNLWKMSKSQFN